MQKDWTAKGLEDPYYWSVTSDRNWNAEKFYATGKRDVEKYITPYFEGTITSNMTALDIGCATGRMTRHMKFGKVVGVDVSASMIEKARIDNPGMEFHVVDGLSLTPLASDTFDFVFSYSSLNHTPRKSYLAGMLKEIHRVLRKGGMARVTVRGFPPNSIGRTLRWRSFERFYVAVGKVRGIPVPYIRRFNTQHGVCLRKKQLLEMTRFFSKSDAYVDATGNLWAELVK